MNIILMVKHSGFEWICAPFIWAFLPQWCLRYWGGDSAVEGYLKCNLGKVFD